MAKQLPEQIQHFAKSGPGVFRFGENQPNLMMANVFWVDHECVHRVKRCGLVWIGRSEGRAG
jgi:hypothetical protein